MAVFALAMSNRVSLAELSAADIRLRPGEAVAIVSAICAQQLTGALPGIPSPGVIRLTREGDVMVEGPITRAHDQDLVVRAALLLTDLLPGYEGLPEYRASGALRLVVARAMGTIDLPPYTSLDEFRTALSRFVTEDVREVARALFSAWERARVSCGFTSAPRTDLTISDVRRARRATGLSLAYLARVADVPPTRLRDLEWGYMRDWPATAEARTQVISYARAAGLDESIVLSIAWPMILENASAAAADSTSSVALVPAPPQAIVVVQPLPQTPAAPPHRWRVALIAAAATAALLGAFAAGSWSSPRATPQHDAGPVAVVAAPARPGVVRTAAPPLVAPAPEPEVRSAGTPVHAKPASAAAPVKAKRRRPPARETARDQRQKRPFLERELFRIVFR
jgi:hypothetical protein